MKSQLTWVSVVQLQLFGEPAVFCHISYNSGNTFGSAQQHAGSAETFFVRSNFGIYSGWGWQPASSFYKVHTAGETRVSRRVTAGAAHICVSFEPGEGRQRSYLLPFIITVSVLGLIIKEANSEPLHLPFQSAKYYFKGCLHTVNCFECVFPKHQSILPIWKNVLKAIHLDI